MVTTSNSDEIRSNPLFIFFWPNCIRTTRQHTHTAQHTHKIFPLTQHNPQIQTQTHRVCTLVCKIISTLITISSNMGHLIWAKEIISQQKTLRKSTKCINVPMVKLKKRNHRWTPITILMHWWATRIQRPNHRQRHHPKDHQHRLRRRHHHQHHRLGNGHLGQTVHC